MTQPDKDSDDLYEPEVEPLMRRFRRAIVREDDENVRRAMSALRDSRPLGYGLIAPEKGPFDEPPAEPVELDPDSLPWELREDDDQREQPTPTE
ncbi:MAG: hypothetical protein ACTHMQ_06850 [Protaetiibacter sp.]